MDQTTIDAYLARIRLAGDAQMRPCGLINYDALQDIAPQRVGIAHFFLRPRFLNADPTGAGKTPMALCGYGYLKEKDTDLKLLVVTTKSAQFQWQRRVAQFMRGVSAEVIGYSERGVKLTPVRRAASYPLQADVWITTYATLTSDTVAILGGLDRFVLVLDEAQKVNNFRTVKRDKDTGQVIGDHHYVAVGHAARKARCVWGLTATPMKNDKLDELYSIFELLRPGTFGDYKQFRRNYYILRLVKPKWVIKGTKIPAKPFYEIIGTQNLDHLRAQIDKFYLRRPVETFGSTLPALTFEMVDVQLEKKQRDLYDTIIAERWPGATDHIHRLAAITYAQQALSAPAVLGFDAIPSAKITELLDRLKARPDDKFIIYSKYVTVIDVIAKELTKQGIEFGRVTGNETLSAREAARLRFQNSPTFNVILITDAGGEALDLQAARNIVFVDLPWSYGNFLQVIGRARRFGSTHDNVLAVLLGANATFDQTIATHLIRKETAIRDIIRQGNTNSDITLSNSISTNSSSDIIDLLFSESPAG